MKRSENSCTNRCELKQ